MMASRIPLRATLSLGSSTTASDIKRVALLFDEVHYVRPDAIVVSDSAAARLGLSDSPVPRERSTAAVHYFRDTSVALTVMDLEPELEETLAALTAHGVAHDHSSDRELNHRDSELGRLRDAILAADIGDPHWNHLTDTSEDDYSRPVQVIDVKWDSGAESTFWVVNEAPAVLSSRVITNALHLSNRLSGFPLFGADLAPLLAYRYEQYRSEERAGDDGATPTRFDARFGAISTELMRAAFSTTALQKITVDELLRYRDEMTLARQRFVSDNLAELTALVSDNPWGAKARDEIQRFVTTTLNGDLATYHAQAETVRDKLFGNLAVEAVSMGRDVALGGGTAGLAATVIPHASGWEMLLAGAGIAALRRAGAIAQDVVRAVQAVRERDRSGIAFIARFPRA